MLKHAEHVSQVASEAGGTIWFELGNSNSYWKDPAVVNYCEKYKLEPVRIDGCRFGLHGNYGLLKKQWRIMTNNIDIYRKLPKLLNDFLQLYVRHYDASYFTV